MVKIYGNYGSKVRYIFFLKKNFVILVVCMYILYIYRFRLKDVEIVIRLNLIYNFRNLIYGERFFCGV